MVTSHAKVYSVEVTYARIQAFLTQLESTKLSPSTCAGSAGNGALLFGPCAAAEPRIMATVWREIV